MRKEKKVDPAVDSALDPAVVAIVETVDAVAAALRGFDYGVDPDDFVIYEAGRLLEEDRASFDDEEFRSLIDESISQHVEEKTEIRAELAGILRVAARTLEPEARRMADRVVRALEDIDCELRNVGVVVRTFTGHVFTLMENFDTALALEEERAGALIERWKAGAVLREQLAIELVAIGRPAAGPLADLLFDSIETPSDASAAIDLLERIPSPVSARVLAHAVSEPMLPEDIEEKAWRALRRLWPLGRHYMLNGLRSHTHEDLPVRWFQVFADADEINTVDRAMEEFVTHGDNPAFQEDLAALLEVLLRSRDPELQDKILQVLNDPKTSRPVAAQLESFLRAYQPPIRNPATDPWNRQQHLHEINRRYLAAARLFDGGNVAAAAAALQDILTSEPGYPFAVMLSRQVPGR